MQLYYHVWGLIITQIFTLCEFPNLDFQFLLFGQDFPTGFVKKMRGEGGEWMVIYPEINGY